MKAQHKRRCVIVVVLLLALLLWRHLTPFKGDEDSLETALLAPSQAMIWAASDGEWIDRTRTARTSERENSVWKDRRIHLFGARNEVISFQVVVTAPSRGIKALSISLPRLIHEEGARTIEYSAPQVDDPTISVGRPIQLFSIHYMQVTKATKANWLFEPGSRAAPSHPLGWKPVQIVPENARREKGGFPLQVMSGDNQALWIEIYLAKDLPRGSYSGELAVRIDGEVTHVPVSLELFDFTLPDDNSMKAMLYYETNQTTLYHGGDVDEAYRRFAHRHRVELVHAYDPQLLEASMARFRGSAYTSAHGYAGPGEGHGDTIIPASFYGPGEGWDNRATAWARSDAWMSLVDKLAPGTLTFLYMPDEPTASDFPLIRTIASHIHTNQGPGRALPLLATSSNVGDLSEAIDLFLAPAGEYDIQTGATLRSQGIGYGVYNGTRPRTGTLLIDAPPTDARSIPWSCFKHDVSVYFYWHSVHWHHNLQKVSERRQNVWANAITFDSRGQPGKPESYTGFANGDGVLMYPGEEKLHPEEDRGLPGPCGTMQLANLRRGLQDHQYLTLAQTLGLKAVVADALQAVVPRVFSEAGSAVGFSESPKAYEDARYILGKAIERAATTRGHT